MTPARTLLLLLVLSLGACLDLESDWDRSATVDEYLLDAYKGGTDFPVSADYAIPDSNILWIDLTSSDGERNVPIQGLFLGRKDRLATDTVILYCHGARDHLDRYYPRLRLLARAGGPHRFGIMTLDYQGFGRSGGQPSIGTMTRDVQAAMDWLLANGVSPGRVALYGYSWGAIPAVRMAASQAQAGRGWLILESPVSSTEGLIQASSGLSLPATFLTDEDPDLASLIPNIGQPFLWMHGSSDREAPIDSEGEPLMTAYAGIRGQAVRVPGAGHTDVPPVIGLEAYLDLLAGFLHP